MEKARIPLMIGVLMFFSGVAVLMVHPGFIASWLIVLGLIVTVGTFVIMHAASSARH